MAFDPFTLYSFISVTNGLVSIYNGGETRSHQSAQSEKNKDNRKEELEYQIWLRYAIDRFGFSFEKGDFLETVSPNGDFPIIIFDTDLKHHTTNKQNYFPFNPLIALESCFSKQNQTYLNNKCTVFNFSGGFRSQAEVLSFYNRELGDKPAAIVFADFDGNSLRIKAVYGGMTVNQFKFSQDKQLKLIDKSPQTVELCHIDYDLLLKEIIGENENIKLSTIQRLKGKQKVQRAIEFSSIISLQGLIDSHFSLQDEDYTPFVGKFSKDFQNNLIADGNDFDALVEACELPKKLAIFEEFIQRQKQTIEKSLHDSSIKIYLNMLEENKGIEKTKQVIGFDLGHGETALAWVSISSNEPPKILEINNQRSFLTAIGSHPELGTLIGNDVLLTPNLIESNIHFKKSPSCDDFPAHLFEEYVRIIDKKIKEKNPSFENDKTHYFVGCPSGWSNKEILEYKKTLSISEVPHLEIVQESRAALLQAKDSGLIGKESLKSSVLVIDVGSSTTDISHVYIGVQDDKMDLGINLGSSLIDELIYQKTLTQHPNCNEVKTFLEDKKHSHIRTKCLFSCREAKEKYWNSEDKYILYDSYVPSHSVKMKINGKLQSFEPILNATTMKEIMKEPIPELNNLSWEGSFDNLTKSANQKLQDKDKKPTLVLLTGGACRMSIIEAICKRNFNNAEIVHYSPPEETVAMGLARWGKIFIHTDKFTKEIKQFCNKELPKEIEKYQERFSNHLAKEVSQQVSGIIESDLIRWRKGYIDTLADMEKGIMRKVKEWFKSAEGIETFENSCSTILQPLATYVDSKTLAICLKHEIPHEALKLETEFDSDESIKNLSVYKPFEGLAAVGGILSFLTIIVSTIILKIVVAGGVVNPLGTGALIAMIAAWAAIIGGGGVMGAVKEISIPNWIRRNTLSESKIRQVVSESESKIQNEIKSAMKEKQFATISQAISKSIKKKLTDKANEVKWIIS